jgi:DNA-binding CsgD family transcriptional regulator
VSSYGTYLATPKRLHGRRSECQTLERLLAGVRAGQSQVLVVRGEAGIGKSALLHYLVDRSTGCRVTQAVGHESEMELAFSGLHQLCAPFLSRLDRLPGPQRDALGTAFGLSAGPPPNRVMVGLATLGLLADVAEDQPLVCVLDDAQWLDGASADVLGFVARRLQGESILIVFAAREIDRNLLDLPELVLSGLAETDANALLASVIPMAVDDRVRERIVAETAGNPLALIELPRGLSAAQLAGGFSQPDGRAISGRVEATFRRRLDSLSAELKLLVLIAAADPVGDPSLLWRAAARAGVGSIELSNGQLVDLVDIRDRVLFRHPLVRSAIYGAAAPSERRRVHAALADATDAESEPDRAAWHRAQATIGPDEQVASSLMEAADRAQRRGGWAAAAAFLGRAVEMTQDPQLRASRALAAAHAEHLAGAPDAALRLLALAESAALSELDRAGVELLKAEVAYSQNRGADAPALLLRAATTLHPLDSELSRQTYLDGLWAAHFAGRFARGSGLVDVARAARAALVPQPLHPSDLLLDGLTTAALDGYAAAAPMLKRAVAAFRSATVRPSDELRWLWHAGVVAMDLWDDESLDLFAARHVELGRATGALAVLPIALSARILTDVFAGRFACAAKGIEELRTLSDLMGAPLPPYGPMVLAAWRGQELEATALIDEAIRDVTARGEGAGVAVAQYSRAVLYNGLGRYSDAFASAADSDLPEVESFTVVNMSLVELIEAGVRSGHTDQATAALVRLNDMSEASGTEWALANRARSQALLSSKGAAESLYQEAIERFARTRIRGQLARAHLLYGEWLRRETRRVDARFHLRTAHELLSDMGSQAFAERARRELRATGEIVRARTVDTRDHLTAQEAQIAQLAAKGRTNPEIGAELFISARTVEWHLRKIFAKLAINSRKQLRVIAPEGE